MTKLQARYVVFVCFLAVLAVPAAAGAFAVHGTVINGTTGDPVPSATVIIVNPSGGMMVEKQITADSEGRFDAEDLDPDAPVHLLRVTYKGVNYTEMVRYDGTDPMHAHVVVYETKTSWDDVHVSIPHVVVARRADTLRVDQFIQIDNEGSPPRTLYGDDASLTVFIPEDKLTLNNFYIMSMGMPVPLSPVATGKPGYYTVPHAIKPGMTQVALSFSVPYGEGVYSYTHTLPRALDEMVIITEDRTMQVTASPIRIESIGDVQGYAAYRLAGLQAGTQLTIGFEGGSAVPPPAPRGGGGMEQSGGRQLSVVEPPTNSLSIVLMIIVTIGLLGLLAFTAAEQREPEIEKKFVKNRKQRLLDQVAKLDDLFQTGAFSEQIYQIKRRELVNELAQIYYRTRQDERGSSRKKRGGACPVTTRSSRQNGLPNSSAA